MEQTPGRTQTGTPTNREQRKAKRAAAPGEANSAQTTEPENARDEARTDQPTQPQDRARPETRRNGTRTTDRKRTTNHDKNLRRKEQQRGTSPQNDGSTELAEVN
ncbi:hypothetical protein [Picosynechococcus sp. PCC 8807]|uniref:hypothetical protein n=1 Tax=Picosynechococcus sp. PCC 8807 TaxID=195248 RepID=UPI00081059DB|nr:hypothetical protein [Picosynechococcus sp. PCC 8807]ANV92084.1 hypothetical protein AWQ24_15000 [Picosynechococcus sp. PCC 8807]